MRNVAQGTGEDDLTAADPGTITRNLRGLASRMEYRVEAIEQRDGNGAGAIQGRGIGIGYLLAKDLANALTEAATYIEGLRAVKPPELTEGKRKDPAPLVVEALTIAEDVLSRSPYSTAIWPNGMHPQTGIEKIRAALASLSSTERP